VSASASAGRHRCVLTSTDRADSSATRNPYYVAQRMIILGKANVLISQFADRLVGLEESVSPE
jgi:hypothetical protein